MNRFPNLTWLLLGDEAGKDIALDRQGAIEDLQVAQNNRQTQAEHKAWKRARALTCEALRMGR